MSATQSQRLDALEAIVARILALLEAKPASPKAKKPRIAENVTPWYEEKPTLECGKCHHMYLTKGGLRQHKANSKVRSCATWKR